LPATDHGLLTTDTLAKKPENQTPGIDGKVFAQNPRKNQPFAPNTLPSLYHPARSDSPRRFAAKQNQTIEPLMNADRR
jgi:hypothetical protein